MSKPYPLSREPTKEQIDQTYPYALKSIKRLARLLTAANYSLDPGDDSFIFDTIFPPELFILGVFMAPLDDSYEFIVRYLGPERYQDKREKEEFIKSYINYDINQLKSVPEYLVHLVKQVAEKGSIEKASFEKIPIGDKLSSMRRVIGFMYLNEYTDTEAEKRLEKLELVLESILNNKEMFAKDPYNYVEELAFGPKKETLKEGIKLPSSRIKVTFPDGNVFEQEVSEAILSGILMALAAPIDIKILPKVQEYNEDFEKWEDLSQSSFGSGQREFLAESPINWNELKNWKLFNEDILNNKPPKKEYLVTIIPPSYEKGDMLTYAEFDNMEFLQGIAFILRNIGLQPEKIIEVRDKDGNKVEIEY